MQNHAERIPLVLAATTNYKTLVVDVTPHGGAVDQSGETLRDLDKYRVISRCINIAYYSSIIILSIGILAVIFFVGLTVYGPVVHLSPGDRRLNYSGSNCPSNAFATCGISGGDLCPNTRPKRSITLLKIIGGQSSSTCTWPWLGALYEQVSDRTPTAYSFVCATSLIGDSWAVTSAHCVTSKSSIKNQTSLLIAKFGMENNDLVRTILFGGSLSRWAAAGISNVKAVYVHPLFDRQRMYYDVALLKFDKDVSCDAVDARRVCLPFRNENLPEPDSPLTIVGWGVTEANSQTPSKMLQQAQISILSQTTCKNIYGGIIDYDYNFCAGQPDGGVDTCRGDSGGPIMQQHNEQNGGWTLVGLTSWGDGCGKPNRPGVYTRISTSVAWIMDKMQSGT